MVKSLAGTNGIPTEGRRAYVGVTAEFDADGTVNITEIRWPGPPPLSLPVRACTERRSVGRDVLGTLVRSWDVAVGRRSARRVVFWERGRFFVERRHRGC